MAALRELTPRLDTNRPIWFQSLVRRGVDDEERAFLFTEGGGGGKDALGLRVRELGGARDDHEVEEIDVAQGVHACLVGEAADDRLGIWRFAVISGVEPICAPKVAPPARAILGHSRTSPRP